MPLSPAKPFAALLLCLAVLSACSTGGTAPPDAGLLDAGQTRACPASAARGTVRRLVPELGGLVDFALGSTCDALYVADAPGQLHQCTTSGCAGATLNLGDPIGAVAWANGHLAVLSLGAGDGGSSAVFITWVSEDLQVEHQAASFDVTKIGAWRQTEQSQRELIGWGPYVSYRFTATHDSRVNYHTSCGILDPQGDTPTLEPSNAAITGFGFTARATDEGWAFVASVDKTTSAATTSLWRATPAQLSRGDAGVTLPGAELLNLVAMNEGLLLDRDTTANGLVSHRWSVCSTTAAPLCSDERALSATAVRPVDVVGSTFYAVADGEVRACPTADLVADRCTWETVASLGVRGDYNVTLQHDDGHLYVMGTVDGVTFGLWQVSL
jgi:hypothetical protein